MDTEMIERVARVLSPQSWQALNTPCDTKAKKKRREVSLDFAKRSIAAIREPTEKMISAGGSIDVPGRIGSASEHYQAMIDAIIGD